ncbi:hypothetical protein [Psychroserpens sp. S379A]|uniref:hypothetical protein n=1 Tax=Psychroserpens sp. S379A TaxID=3415137 RepID=UPI003C7E17C5
MINQIFVIVFFILISCNKTADKKSNTTGIKEDSTDLRTEFNGKELNFTKPTLEFEKILETIDSTFQIKNAELNEVFKPWKEEYYSILDSTKIKKFQKYSEFLIIEFYDNDISLSEFDKLSAIAKKSEQDKKELFPFYQVFRKGGITFNNIDKWIIIHFLRCNMSKEEYEMDSLFTNILKDLNSESSSMRMRCGWPKTEFN